MLQKLRQQAGRVAYAMDGKVNISVLKRENDLLEPDGGLNTLKEWCTMALPASS